LAAREVAYKEVGTGRDVFERTERADVEATDSVRLRPGSWEVTATDVGTASEDGPLLALAMLAIEPLHEDEVEDVEMREVRRERAAAVI
jgi:hypothetical protein